MTGRERGIEHVVRLRGDEFEANNFADVLSVGWHLADILFAELDVSF